MVLDHCDQYQSAVIIQIERALEDVQEKASLRSIFLTLQKSPSHTFEKTPLSINVL